MHPCIMEGEKNNSEFYSTAAHNNLHTFILLSIMMICGRAEADRTFEIAGDKNCYEITLTKNLLITAPSSLSSSRELEFSSYKLSQK